MRREEWRGEESKGRVKVEERGVDMGKSRVENIGVKMREK